MTHDRDTGRYEGLDLGNHGPAALELDGPDTGLLHESRGRAHSLFATFAIRAKRHIADYQGFLGRANDARGQRQQLVQAHPNSRLVAVDHIGGRVAHQESPYTGVLENRRSEGVVARQHHPPFVSLLGGNQVRCRYSSTAWPN